MRKPHYKISHHGYNVAGDNVRPRKVSGTLNILIPQLATSNYNLGSGIELAGLVGDGGARELLLFPNARKVVSGTVGVVG